jgi:hypothetical protein
MAIFKVEVYIHVTGLVPEAFKQELTDMLAIRAHDGIQAKYPNVTLQECQATYFEGVPTWLQQKIG